MVNRIEIKDYFSPDIENVWEWTPLDIQSVYFRLDVYVGEKELDSSTIFSLIVTSPEALISRMTKDPFLWGRGYLIIKDYSFNKVEKAIKELIRKCSEGKSTMEAFYSLNRNLFWEYSPDRE